MPCRDSSHHLFIRRGLHHPWFSVIPGVGWKDKKAILIGILALLLVTPSVFYAAGNFQPSSSEGFKEAQEFLVKFRLPHHCLPQLWLDWVACLQILWIMLSIFLLRKQKELTVILVPFLLGALLTILQVVTQSNTLALLFPLENKLGTCSPGNHDHPF